MERLKNLLKGIDGKGFKAYKDLLGDYEHTNFKLEILNIQGDPFASPTMFHMSLSLKKLGVRDEFYEMKFKRLAFEDFLLREIYSGLENKNLTNEVFITKPQNEIIKRSAIAIKGDNLSIKYYFNLPAKGRNVLGEISYEKIKVLSETIYNFIKDFDLEKAKIHVELNETIELLREKLKKEKIKTFIGNGSILFRENGVGKLFVSPKTLEKEFHLKNGVSVKGMCIKEGVTVVTGGLFHGKSTLLTAIKNGVYNHIAGDGKEFVITDREAVNIVAEAGRTINGVDVSYFVNNNSKNEDMKNYYTENASGLLSQAASVIEAIELGASLLLVDEDSSVTNFMFRDKRLNEFFVEEDEIKPFVNIVKELHGKLDISTIVTTSSIGDFFYEADEVLLLKDCEVLHITDKVKKYVNENVMEPAYLNTLKYNKGRLNIQSVIEEYQGKKLKLKTNGTNTIALGRDEVSLSCENSIVDNGQLNFIGEIIKKIFSRAELHEKTLKEILEIYDQRIEAEGIEAVLGIKNGSLVYARKYEIASIINRIKRPLFI